MADEIEWWPIDEGRWGDLEELFGPEGAYKNCWCMWYRQTESEHFAGVDGRNRSRLRELVRTGPPPGILLYLDGEPAGWCSLGPREDFGRILRSPSVRPFDARSAWALVCFYVAEEFRERGLQRALLHAAVSYARERGAGALEAYPFDRRVSTMDAHVGSVSTYEEAGFEEVHRRTATRPIMRLDLTPDG